MSVPMSRIALSSWAVDPLLVAGSLELRDLPREARARGFERLEVCHFHLPPESAARAEFADGARAAGTTLQTLLVDDGEATEEAFISEWLDEAERLGFERARVIAGRRPPSDEALARSAAALARLARGRSLRVVVENWHALLPDAASVNGLLDRVGANVGLCADFGNWNPADELPLILPRSETIHAKAEFRDGAFDEDDLARKLRWAREAGFEGRYVLVAADAGDVWGSLARTAAFVAANG